MPAPPGYSTTITIGADPELSSTTTTSDDCDSDAISVEREGDHPDNNIAELNQVELRTSTVRLDQHNPNHNNQEDEELVEIESESPKLPEWSINYQSNESSNDENSSISSNTPSITTRDLISWAFQIARGMDYLASKNVI